MYDLRSNIRNRQDSPQDEVEVDLESNGTNETPLQEEHGNSSENEHQTPRRYPQRPQRQHHPPVRLTYDRLGSSVNTFSCEVYPQRRYYYDGYINPQCIACANRNMSQRAIQYVLMPLIAPF